MSKMEPITVVQVDFNVPADVDEQGEEFWKAFCDRLDAEGPGVLQVDELVLAVTETPGEGFVARVVSSPVARGKMLDPHTGEAKQVYRVLITPVDISALRTVKA